MKRTFKLHSLNNFQIHSTVLLTTVTILYITFPMNYFFYNWKLHPTLIFVSHHKLDLRNQNRKYPKGIKLSYSLPGLNKSSPVLPKPWRKEHNSVRFLSQYWVSCISFPSANPWGPMGAKWLDVWHSPGPNFPFWKGMENTLPVSKLLHS